MSDSLQDMQRRTLRNKQMKSFSLNSNLIKVVHSPGYPISEIDSGSSGENIFRNLKIMTFSCFRAEAREIEATWLSGTNIFLFFQINLNENLSL